MLGMEYGLDHFKFFQPKRLRIPMLKSIAVPFTSHFCPTGGISPENYNAYLKLSMLLAWWSWWHLRCSKIKKLAKITELAKEPSTMLFQRNN